VNGELGVLGAFVGAGTFLERVRERVGRGFQNAGADGGSWLEALENGVLVFEACDVFLELVNDVKEENCVPRYSTRMAKSSPG
jgi:hypothetical protein